MQMESALAHRLRRYIRSRQLQVGIVVMASLWAFGIVATRPGSFYATTQLLLTYNAIILGYLSSFWGLWRDVPAPGFDGLPYSPRRIALAERDRLIWSLAPSALGGCGIFLPLVLPQDVGTLMLLTGFALLVTLEALGPKNGFPQADYKGLRWVICFTAMIILADVLANQRWSFRIFF